MAAIDLRALVRRVAQLVRRLAALRARPRQTVQAAGLIGGALASGVAGAAANLPEDRADAMYHVYDGGGLTASGPALLVRKKFADTVSLSASYYIDMVSNASIDVVTTASPYKETRKEYIFGADYVVRDATVSVSTSNSKEPDYIAKATSIDVSQEVFGGMTTLSLGYTRAHDNVGRHNEGFFDNASHWRYRFGATQILTPSWLASLNFEAVSDDGFLGSAYRQAMVFGATVPERNPRTRSSRSVQLRTVAEILPGQALRFDYRYFWDTWAIKAHTTELRYSRSFSDPWLVDWYGRYYTQGKALFYSDNAMVDTTYVSRNRQLSTFKTMALGAKVAYTLKHVPGQYEIKLNAAYEHVRFKYSDFTDIRDGKPYEHDARVFQLFVSGTF
ncbi:MAG: DUF3570 domain-containing protein [Rhizobacter sp.]|nr:DUF3570 domain-containing protein [Rhizobacter sp.]